MRSLVISPQGGGPGEDLAMLEEHVSQLARELLRTPAGELDEGSGGEEVWALLRHRPTMARLR